MEQNADLPEMSDLALETKIEDLYYSYRPDLPDTYLWEDERDRFNELCFCILARTTPIDELALREILTGLSELNVLDVEALAESEGGSNSKSEKTLDSIITNVFIQNGLDDKEAEKCTATIRQISRIVKQNYGGNIQRLIRKFGNEMLEEMQKVFAIQNMTKEDLKVSLVLWMQNTMEMPIPVSNDAVRDFCKSNNIGLKELESALDTLDINAAVIDDLIQAASSSKQRKRSGKK